MVRLPTFESPTRADALVHHALLFWSVIAAAFLAFLVVGGETQAPDSWNLGVQIADGFYQTLSLAVLAFVLGVRRADKGGLPMRFAPVIGRGFVLALPWVMLALVGARWLGRRVASTSAPSA